MYKLEIIQQLKSLLANAKYQAAYNPDEDIFRRDAEALEVATAALRPVSRERMKKMRGEWMGSADGYADGELVYDIWECSHCGYVIDEEDDPDMLPQFCPKCCSVMTDEAVDMAMERLEELCEAIHNS